MTATCFTKPLCVLFICIFPAVAGAGRPLLVDDAATNESGHGHVESWYDTEGRVFHIAPAFAPIDDLELGAAFAKSNFSGETSYSLQAKNYSHRPKKMDATRAPPWAGPLCKMTMPTQFTDGVF